jgi:hypothetical protein
MESLVKVSCTISSSDTQVPLSLEIWLDEQCIFEQYHVREPINFAHEFSDSDGEHELRFVMKNKRAEYTRIDESGNIVSDACLTIKDLAFDEIQLGHMFTELATYTHDFNGTGQPTQDKFFDVIGCNGTVALKFSTPVYLWLLENM